jgi:hypothetical protein
VCRSTTDPILRPCERLLQLMSCDLRQLIDLLRVARVAGSARLQLVSVVVGINTGIGKEHYY